MNCLIDIFNEEFLKKRVARSLNLKFGLVHKSNSMVETHTTLRYFTGLPRVRSGQLIFSFVGHGCAVDHMIITQWRSSGIFSAQSISFSSSDS